MLRSMLASAGARLIALPITALTSALSTFLVVAHAGPTAFGYVNLIATLFLLIPFADLGLGAAIVNGVAGGLERGDLDKARRLTRTAFITLVISGAALLALSAALAGLEALAPLIGVPAVYEFSNLAVFMAIAPFAISLPFGLGQRVLLGLGLNHLVNLYSIVGPVVALAVTWMLVELGAPVLFIACATPIGVLCTSLLAFVAAARRTGWGWRVFEAAPGRGHAAELWSAASPMIVVTVASPIALQSGRLILGHTGSGAELAEYSLAYQFFLPALSVATTAGVALWPIFARDRSANRKPWLRGLAIMSVLGVVIAGTYAVFLPPVAALVSQEQITVPLVLTLILALQLALMSVHQASGTLLTTPRGLRYQAFFATLMAVLTVGIGLLLAPAWGGAGVAAGACVGLVVGQLVPSVILAWNVTKERT